MRLQAEQRQKAANDRIIDLRKKLDRIQKDIDEAEQEAAEWEDFLAKYTMLANGKTKQEENRKGDKILVKRGSLPGMVAEILLANKGKSMTMTEIIEALRANKVAVDKENFRTILNTALWRRKGEGDLFEKTADGYKIGADYELVD